MIYINASLYELVIKYKDDISNEQLINDIKIIAKKYKLTKEETEKIIKELISKWFKTFLTIDPTDYIKNIKCPALILFGEKYLKVPAIENEKALNFIATENNKTNLNIFVIPQANHLFQKANTGNIYEYALIKGTIDFETLNIIKEFLLSFFQ